MFEMLEDYDVQKVRKESMQKGREEGKIEVAKNLLKDGTDISYILKITGLTEEKVKILQAELNVDIN